MLFPVLILAAVTVERGVELAIAGRNTRRLKAAGGFEVGAGHYPLIVGLHAVWLLALWTLAWDRPVQPVLLALFLLLQAARIWVLVTLGPRWTTRIIIVPGESLVRRGPYRFVDHPNYLVVAGEIALLPLVFGLAEIALLFTVVNALVLALRIRAEDAALGRLDQQHDRANLRL